MEDLKRRITALLEEIEYTELKRKWPEQLGKVGMNEREAHKWAAEIGHVVAEYQNSLKYLVGLLQETDLERIPQRIYDWAGYTRDISIFIYEDAVQHLQEQVQALLPSENDEVDDEDDSS